MPLIKPQSQFIKTEPVTIRRFYNLRNKILISRNTGGAGDILMHRMIFEDVKKLLPDCHLTFACPPHYFDLVSDHPYLDRIMDSRKVDPNDFWLVYNTSTACGRYEFRIAPKSGPHRSDIWAAHCGYKLSNHEMHIQLTAEEKNFGSDCLRKYNPDPECPSILFSPVSASLGKDLLHSQIEILSELIKAKKGVLIGCHHEPLNSLTRLSIPTIYGINMRQWMGVVNAADYVISVDTSTFHMAGGLKRPLLGIFTYADGKVYSKYYNSELIQKHRDDGWDCGPCYNWGVCKKSPPTQVRKPCLTEISIGMLIDGVDRLFNRWPWGNQKNSLHLPILVKK